MERQRLHVMAVTEILPQAAVVGIHHPRGGARVDVALPVMAGVKQKPRRARDADIAQAEKERAERLAVPLGTHQLARSVVLIDDRLKLRHPATLAIRLRASRKRRR